MARQPVVAAALALAMLGCRTAAPVDAPPDVPAVIVRPTDASRAALARAVSDALGGARVTLADYALTNSSELVIERMLRRGPAGEPIDPRGEKPEKFQLVKSGADCVLIHDETGRRFKLVDTE